MLNEDARAQPRRILGRDVQNEGRYERPCKVCGAPLMMAKMAGPHRYGWWALNAKPIDERGIRYYTVHDCQRKPDTETGRC